LIFSNPLSDVQALKTELDQLEFVDFNVIPLDPQVAEVFGMKTFKYKLLRPDNYIVRSSAEVSLKHYLKQLTTQSDTLRSIVFC